MFTSLAQCAKVSFLFLEVCGTTEWIVENVFSLECTFINSNVFDLWDTPGEDHS